MAISPHSPSRPAAPEANGPGEAKNHHRPGRELLAQGLDEIQGEGVGLIQPREGQKKGAILRQSRHSGYQGLKTP